MQGKTLIAHVTAGGATEMYANVVAETLRANGCDVDVVNLRREKVDDLSGYSSVVLGTGVRMSMVYRRGRSFLARSDLKGKPLGIFLSSAMALDKPDEAREKFLDPLVQKNGLSPVMHDAFPGKVPLGPGKLEDKTDADIARKWAEEFARKLGEA
jgi:menaquinone-dependent protoporphyrinogen IX oxidase